MPSPAGALPKSAIPATSASEGLSEADLYPTFEEWKEELAEAGLPARHRNPLLDVTPLARHVGLLPPTSLTARLWADIQAIPPGFETETVHSRLVNVLQNAFLAVVSARAQENADTVAEEFLVFAVSLPTVGHEISDYPVVLRFRPGAANTPVLLLMAPEEVSAFAAKSPVIAL